MGKICLNPDWPTGADFPVPVAHSASDENCTLPVRALFSKDAQFWVDIFRFWHNLSARLIK
jgi:hypothetical protein